MATQTAINTKEGSFRDNRNRKILFRSWIPSRTHFQLFIIHGFAEHMRYYGKAAEFLGNNGVAVHAMDLPGHGLSEGKRCHIDDFQEYIDSVFLFMTSNPNVMKTKPSFILGHSLGGLISSHVCLQNSYLLKGLILSSPLTGFSPSQRLVVGNLAKWLARKNRNTLYPKPRGMKTLSRDPASWVLYNNDPLRGQNITPNLYLTMMANSQRLQNNAYQLSIPLLIFMTAKDQVVDPFATQRFFKNCGSLDKTMVVYTQAMHELFQEKERSQLLPKLISWMEERSV